MPFFQKVMTVVAVDGRVGAEPLLLTQVTVGQVTVRPLELFISNIIDSPLAKPSVKTGFVPELMKKYVIVPFAGLSAGVDPLRLAVSS